MATPKSMQLNAKGRKLPEWTKAVCNFNVKNENSKLIISSTISFDKRKAYAGSES